MEAGVRLLVEELLLHFDDPTNLTRVEDYVIESKSLIQIYNISQHFLLLIFVFL